MTTPDRLEQVLDELEALEQAAQTAPSPSLVEWNDYDAAAIDAAPFFCAKLRAAMEMEKALRTYPGDIIEDTKDWRARYRAHGDAIAKAIIAWQQAGEEER